MFFGLGGGLLVFALVVVLLLTVGGGASPDSLVDKTVSALNKKDTALVKEVSCDKNETGDLNDDLSSHRAGVRLSFLVARSGDVVENGDTAQAPITIKVTASAMGKTITKNGRSTVKLRKANGDWCVNDITEPTGTTGN